MEKQRFLVYKASGGLAHSLGGLYKAIDLAKRTARFLIIDYKKHTAFEHNFGEFFKLEIDIPYSDNYDPIPKHFTYKGHSIEELKNQDLGENYSIFNESTKGGKDNDQIIVSGGTGGNRGWLSIDELKVNDKIMQRLQKEQKIKEPYISVHYRNTDIRTKITNHVHAINLLAKEKKIKTVYICSDYYNALSDFKKYLPKMNLIMYAKPEKVDNVLHFNLHYGAKDKGRQIYEVIRDLYMIFQSDYFIPCGSSGLSRMVITMMEKKKNMFNLPHKTIFLY